MIVTEAIFTYLSRLYRSLHVFSLMDEKEMKELHSVHMLDIHSTVVYRLDTLVPRLDITAVISCNNSYDGQNSHPIKRILRYHVNF